MGHAYGPTKYNCRRLRAWTGQYDRSEARIQVTVRVGVRRGRNGSIPIQRCDIDVVVRMIGMAVTVHAVTVTVGAVTVCLAMVVARRRRHMMIGAERAVRGERKRRHNRESGCDTSAQQMGEPNHPHT
jgi:hypothetical protein